MDITVPVFYRGCDWLITFTEYNAEAGTPEVPASFDYPGAPEEPPMFEPLEGYVKVDTQHVNPTVDYVNRQLMESSRLYEAILDDAIDYLYEEALRQLEEDYMESTAVDRYEASHFPLWPTCNERKGLLVCL